MIIFEIINMLCLWFLVLIHFQSSLFLPWTTYFHMFLKHYSYISFYQGQIDLKNFTQFVRLNPKRFYSIISTNKVSNFALFNTVLCFISVEYDTDYFVNSCRTFCLNVWILNAYFCIIVFIIILLLCKAFENLCLLRTFTVLVVITVTY